MLVVSTTVCTVLIELIRHFDLVDATYKNIITCVCKIYNTPYIAKIKEANPG